MSLHLPSPLRAIAAALVFAVLGAGVGLVFAVGAPYLLGWRSFTVMSGSMEPAIGTGDVVVNARITPLDARPGNVVTFSDPDPGHPRRLITHRVTAVKEVRGTAQFITKGDANRHVERWTVDRDGEIGRVAYRVPHMGHALAWTQTRYGLLGLIVVPALLLGVGGMRRIWMPKREPEASDAAAA